MTTVWEPQCSVPCVGIWRFETDYRTDFVTIEDSNQYQDEDKEGSNEEMIDGIDSNIGTSQLGNAHVLTVLWAIVQVSQKGKWWIR